MRTSSARSPMYAKRNDWVQTLIALPELFRSQYFCQREDHALFDLAEPVPGPTVDRLAGVARELGVGILAPVFERRAAGVYHNTVAVIERDGRIAGIYRKMHIPDDPCTSRNSTSRRETSASGHSAFTRAAWGC